MKQPRLLILVMMAPLLLTGALARAGSNPLPEFTPLVKHNSAAVVNISTTREADAGGTQVPFPDMPENSPFNEFFKRFFQQQRGGHAHEVPVRSLGSGFIISPDGYILTNAHVVKDADNIVVHLSDRRERPAKLVGLDERTDVAVLKIKMDDLPTVDIGNSDDLKVGQWVLAIGSPFGFEETATQGIISALGRSLPNDTYVPFIQTDVAVNPGNSGGPLFTTDGKVIGINSQIYSNTGGYMGLSFAIPINVAMQVAKQLETKGYSTHGWLGVSIQPVSQELAEAFGLKRPHGTVVAQVMPDSPAQKAGLKSGDIILSYDGQKIEISSDLPPLVGETAVGKKVEMDVLRDGKKKEIYTTIEALPDKLAKASPTAMGMHKTGDLNIDVANLDAKQQQKLGDRGVEVKEVGPGPAAKAGVRPGDILLRLGDHDITDAAELSKLVNEIPRDKPEPLLLQRHGSNLFLALKFPPR
jgi:serine protease Do